MAEIGVGGAGGEDEGVVRDWVAVGEPDLADAGSDPGIDAGDLGQQGGDVAQAPGQPADRPGNL